jgi:hypothetical protein
MTTEFKFPDFTPKPGAKLPDELFDGVYDPPHHPVDIPQENDNEKR